MILKELKHKISLILKDAGIESHALDASVILEHIAKKGRAEQVRDSESEISAEDEEKILRIASERKKRRPLAQILNRKEFYGLDFFVNEHTLIPRPETEDMVDLVLRSRGDESLSMLDLCCGSGCIGISILYQRKGWSCEFADISQPALDAANANAERLIKESDCRFTRSDLFSGVCGGHFDVIVCNPPYIDPSEKPSLEPELFFEPHDALFSDRLPQLYFEIIEGAGKRLNAGGMLYLELAPAWAGDVLTFAEGMFSGKIHRDLNGLERIVEFQKNT